jgi:histidinol dehydrogenase
MLRIKALNELTDAETDRLMHRAGQIQQDIEAKVDAILDAVRREGDAALKRFTARFDGADLDDLRVTPAEIAAAYDAVPPAFVEAFKTALAHSTQFERTTFPVGDKVETRPGVKVWREWRPIERVGLYIPGGQANYPSSLLMTAVPAKIAGCLEFIVCTPCKADGKVSAATLVACDLCGVERIYKLGGAQAIGAMAYGTATVSAVDKIFGAGNTFVTTAKLLVSREVAIDMPAGPSEIMILADDSADPAYLAADLLSQAEHGPDSASVLVTDAPELARRVVEEAERQTARLATADTIRTSLGNFGMIVLVDDLDTGAAFANRYAPEHLEIVTRNDRRYLNMINNVGSVFLGPFAPEPAGDYATGSNHVLPTAGFARMYNPLSVESFGKKIQVQRLTKGGLAALRDTIGTLADAEQLPAHKAAVEIRFREDNDER